ncbi:hypothetical protein J4557_09950, partial [Actinomadura nitritigenes]
MSQITCAMGYPFSPSVFSVRCLRLGGLAELIGDLWIARYVALARASWRRRSTATADVPPLAVAAAVERAPRPAGVDEEHAGTPSREITRR